MTLDFGLYDRATNDKPWPSYRLPPPLIELAGKHGIEIELSFYGTETHEDESIAAPATNSFQVTSSGVFMERRGAGWNRERHSSQKKLCFIATDPALLARVLSELAERSDCYYVKYSIKPRDGMYLGRCFLLDDQVAGALWREYKKHPKLMCNLQDDDFTLPFR